MTCETPFDRFALTTGALSRAVAACLGRGLMTAAMIVLVFTRVKRAEFQFLALVERVRSGRFRGGFVRDGARLGKLSGAAKGGAFAAEAQKGRLPLGFGWLMRVMPYEAAGYAGQLQTLLAEPEMADLVRDVAQARRILGPLCRMLGVKIAGLRPKAAACGQADSNPCGSSGVAMGAVAGRTRVKRTRAVVDWGRIPLPRGVLAAARRQGFGKIVKAE